MGRKIRRGCARTPLTTVLHDQETYNIIGTIPHCEEGMILLSAHYDLSVIPGRAMPVVMMLGIAISRHQHAAHTRPPLCVSRHPNTTTHPANGAGVYWPGLTSPGRER